ncbi:phage tail length tape measure family protein [Stutzerimonas nitrititolerans]|uniref:phage tail length tape measure family protein n=1 Tax=Stutzerimonas nitrititolerans TaxID=2482751 RepID=UPI0014825DA9|nr:phage tail length tape measure family protein [Stutzerimonas nitrititolerans]NNT92297.1 tape measure domain-containing protein [Stutzerimonas nitrititolerans]
MSIKDRLIQFVLRGKDELSPAAETSSAALDALRQEAEQLGQALDKAKEAQGLAQALRQTERAVEQTERSLVQADLQIRELRDALNKSPEGAGLQQSLKEAEREARKLQRGLDTLRTSLGDQQQAAKAAGIDTDNLGDEHKRLAAETDKAKKALADNNTQLKAAQREQNAAARATAEHSSRIDAARESMSRGAKQVLAFAAAYVSLNAAFGLVQRGLSLVAQGIRAVATSGSEEQQALGQLEAALASTGRQAEFTTKQLQEMADQLEDRSMLNAEPIQSAQARLLSYTDVAATEFPRAMQIIIDQQQRLGISVEQSAEIVGRALQSPSEAIATLGRQGFKLEDGQKRLLKQLEATGKTAEAQAIIMDMLTEAYGGSAAAAKLGTFEGLLKTIGKQIGDFTKRVKNAGAFEFMQRKLLELSDYLDEMANDGRLDRLAQGLSDAFVQGAEWVEGFIRQLAGVDFKKLTDDSAAWLSSFGTHLDEASARLKLFVAPFRTLFNGLTAGLSGFAALITSKMSEILGAVGKVAEYLPSMLGGEKLRAAVADARGVLDGLTEGFREQVEQDGKDIAAAWSTTTETVKTKAAEQTAAIKQEADDQFEHIVQRVTDMNNALAQIDAAEGAAQLKQLGEEMYKAYQRGDLSQQQFASGMAIVHARLKDLGSAAGGAAGFVSDLEDKLGDLSKVQAAISNAKTDVDINNIRTALKKLYGDGQITAAQYNEELKKAADRQRELKGAIDDGAAAQAKKNAADKEAIKTSADLRVESGKRMEAERRAGDQAMQDRRRGSEEAQRDMGAMEDFFGGVMTRAREPLAAMSDAALEAFDRLNGLSTANIEMDTSSLDATTSSLRRATEALDEMQAAANTVGMSSIGKWMTQTALQSQQLQIQFLGQKARLQSLMEGYEDGSITVQQFVRRASSARHAMSLLNDSDLRTLESAIQAAKDRMEQMANSTRSTLEGLQDELDNLQGRTEDIERRRFASRRRELEAQMAEANAQGDSQAVANAARALGMLRQIESETAQQRQREEQQKRIDAQQQPQGAAPQQAQAPGKVIRLEVPGRQAVDVAVRSEADETKLLGVLESAGLRSL